jgi:hypothetical protein
VWRALEQGTDMPEAHGVQGFVDEMRELGLVCGGTARTPSENVPDRTLPPPQVVWREELRSFAFSCGRISGETPACEQVPTT